MKQSGKFKDINVKLSKKSKIVSKNLHMMTLNRIDLNRNDEAKNPVLRSFYDCKCLSKPKINCFDGCYT